MRALAFLIPIALGGCAQAETEPPSLAPRPAEAIDPRVPVAEMIISPDVSFVLLEQLKVLVNQALAGDAAFQSAAANAERLAATAGPPQSESWIVAQQALSAAVAARAPVTGALGAIDALGAVRIQQSGGISAADMAAITAASARVAEIDAREAALIDRVQALLRG
jgi:hypothetical protein